MSMSKRILSHIVSPINRFVVRCKHLLKQCFFFFRCLNDTRQSRWFGEKDLIVVASILETNKPNAIPNCTYTHFSLSTSPGGGVQECKAEKSKIHNFANGWALLLCQRIGAIANNGNSFKQNCSVISCVVSFFFLFRFHFHCRLSIWDG